MVAPGDLEEFAHRCELIIKSLPIRWPFELNTFLDALGRRRGKPITLMRANLGDAMPPGMWMSTTTADYLVVVRDTPPGHVLHIAFHEVGHLELDHPVHRQCGHLDSENFDPGEEAEAELFAYQLGDFVRGGERRQRTRRSRPGVHQWPIWRSRRQPCRT